MLRSSLKGHQNIEAKSEIFNPDFISEEPFDENTPEEAIIDQYLFYDYPQQIKAVGFILHRSGAPYGNWPNLWQLLEDDIDLRIVSLTRHNLLRRYLSYLVMHDLIRNIPPSPRTFTVDELKKEFIRYEQENALFEQRFSRHAIFRVSYEELCSDFRGVMHRLQLFLDAPPKLLQPQTTKILAKPLSQEITNFLELQKAFMGTRWAWYFDTNEDVSSKVGIMERYSGPVSQYDPQLGLFHNTRHASPKHLFTQKNGPQLRSPWLSRFDWILDVDLEAGYSENPETVLTKQRVNPRCVFVKLNVLPMFVSDVLPQLHDSVLLYIGNSNTLLSNANVDIQELANHPMIHRIFCENKTHPIDSIQAMPIGIHPRELVSNNNGYRLHALSRLIDDDKKFDINKKTNKVMGSWKLKISIQGTREDRYELKKWMQALPDLFAWYDMKPQQEYWQNLAKHRFMLAPWGGNYDTGRIFEALALKTIPIVFSGTYTEAYAGLPVVVIQQINDITKQKLDHWWESLKPLFSDMEFLQGKYWWHKVKRALPVRKRAFLVVGPESQSTRQVTDILVRAGCHEHSGDHSDWQNLAGLTENDNAGDTEENEFTEPQPGHGSQPQEPEPIVWRHRFSHPQNLPDIAHMAASLEDNDYTVTVVVVNSDKQSPIQPQTKCGRVKDATADRPNNRKAYLHIFRHIELAEVPYIMVNYESLLQDPHAQEQLLQELGIAKPKHRIEVVDGNKKLAEGLSLESMNGDEVGKSDNLKKTAADFPEYWFTCQDRQSQYDYESSVEKGQDFMKGSRTILCGLARDIVASLPVVSARVERLGKMFAEYRIVLFENDSKDRTLDYLEKWQKHNPRLHVITETLAAPKWNRSQDVNRTRDMASYRNRYVDYVQKQFTDFDYAIVLDTDNKQGFSYDGIAHSFSFCDSGTPWHAVGSNSLWVPEFDVPATKPMFFDAFAFRHVGDETMRPIDELNNQHFRRGHQMLPVWSCFGGLAIYDMKAFACGVRYGGGDCEHVIFHRRLRERGFDRQFLNPNQIVLYSS